MKPPRIQVRLAVLLLAVSWLPSPARAATSFRRGDANGDGKVDISDGVATLGTLFLGTGSLACEDAADADDSGTLNITDAIFTFSFLFVGGRSPPPPGAFDCGIDATADGLACSRYEPAQAERRCGGSAPVLTKLGGPASIPLGGTADVAFHYADADGDIGFLEMDSAGRHLSVVPAGPLGIEGPSGQASLQLRAADLPFATPTTFTLRLIDRRGLASEPASFTTTVAGATTGGSAPAIASFTPSASSWNRPAGSQDELRPLLTALYADPDADIERLRIHIALPDGQEVTAEEPAGRLRIAGATGSVGLRPFVFRSTSVLGEYRIELTPIDRSGNSGEPAAATVELLTAGGRPPLAITGIDPDAGPAGTEVAISGTGFDAAAIERNLVEMSEWPVELLAATETTLTVRIPDGPPTSRIVVKSGNGAAVSDAFFLVPPSVTVSPPRARVPVGASLSFAARVVSAPDPAVTWLVDGLEGGSGAAGTIDAEGRYSAPAAIPPGGGVTIEARLNSDPSVAASASVEILPPTAWPGKALVLAAVGGVVASVDGRAALRVPAGAFAADTEISVDAVELAALPAAPAGFRLLGAVELGPSGLTFGLPAWAVIPLARYTRPGTRLPLRFLSPAGTFIDEGLQATVAPNGEQAVAPIPHFSLPVVLEQLTLEPEPSTVEMSITGITPAEAQEGLRVPVLVTGANLDDKIERVEVLTQDGSPTTDIAAGTVYPVGDRAGLLLSIDAIQDLRRDARRTYRLRFHRLTSLERAEVEFTVVGLDELIVPLGTTLVTGGSGVERYSEIEVGGTLRVEGGELELEATGSVNVLGFIDSRGSRGADAPNWLCGGLQSGEGPESCGRAGARDGRGGVGRERETIGEVAGESLGALLGQVPIIGGALSAVAHEILDSPDEEHDGAHAASCNSDAVEGCARGSFPRGVGGNAGANIDLEEIRGETAALVVDCIDCIGAIIDANPLGLVACDAVREDVEALFGTFVTISHGPSGRRGIGARPGGWGGGGGGGGRFKTIAIPILDQIGISNAGNYALAIDGGGGGGGGGPAEPVSMVAAGELRLMSPLGQVDLDRVLHLVRHLGNLDGILDQLPRGRISTEGGEGGNGSPRGRVTITTNNVLAKLFLDLIDWPTVGAFEGGGGGGGAGARIELAAAMGIQLSGAVDAQVIARGGEGGLGGGTAVDPDTSAASSLHNRSELSRGTNGSVDLNAAASSYAYLTRSSEGELEVGNMVTNRNFLLVRFSSRAEEPRPVVTRNELGEERTVMSTPDPQSGVHWAQILLSQGFNTLLGGHELLDRRILCVFADADADGLSDADEVSLLLDPANPDTDGDGYSDGEEIRLGSNARNPDGDRDGLLDPEEFALGTDPVDSDSDDDGVRDGAEIRLGTDPLDDASLPAAIPEGTLLAASAAGFLSVVDTATGGTGALGKAAGGLGFGLAYGGDGRLFIASFGRLTVVDPLQADAAGQLAETEIGTFGAPDGRAVRVSQIAYHPDDAVFYGVELGPGPQFLETGQLVSISPATAAAARIGPPGANAIHALAVDPDGKLLAAVAGDAASDRLVELDRATGGVAGDIGAIGFSSVYGLGFDRDGRLWASALRVEIEAQLLAIDPATGIGSHVVDVDRALLGLAFAPCPAPCSPGSVEYTEYAVGALPDSIAAIDLNGDSRPELVTSHGAAMSILANQGDGTFAPAVPLANVGYFASRLAIGDMNGDGRPDLVAATNAAGRPGVAVLPGRGDGTLGPPQLTSVVTQQGFSKVAAVGDLDLDHDLDIAALYTTSPGGGQSVRALLGNGDGTFALGPIQTGFSFPVAAALGDVNGDSLLDLAVTEQVTATVSISLGDGAGSFAFLRRVPAAGTAPFSGLLLDLNRDGKLDIALANSLPEGLNTALGNGDGTFAPMRTYPPAGFHPNAVAAGDVDRDGDPDLVTIDLESFALSLFIGKGDGTVEAAVPLPAPDALPRGEVVVDLDGDGAADAAVVADPGNGPGTVGVLLKLR